MSDKVVRKFRAADDRDSMAIALEDLSSDIRSGKVNARTVILIIDEAEDANVAVKIIGHRPRKSTAIGLMEYAKQQVYDQ